MVSDVLNRGVGRRDVFDKESRRNSFRMEMEGAEALQFHPGIFATVAVVAVVHQPHAGIRIDLEAGLPSPLARPVLGTHRNGSAKLCTMHECPYGSPQIKHSGINIRCSSVEPDRQPAARRKIGRSLVVLVPMSGQRVVRR